MKATTKEDTAVKHVKPGVRSYRGILLRISKTIPSGYWGHWESAPVNGETVRGHNLTDMKVRIDEALKAAATKVVEARAITPAFRYASSVAVQPATPWHVERKQESYGASWAVYPSPEVVDGSRMAVASDIRLWHVALLTASAPEMLALLQRVELVMRADHAENTSLYKAISILLTSLKAPPPEGV